METREIPKIVFPNTSEAILEYLIKRTGDTIGKQIDRSDAILAGHVEKEESSRVPVRPEHLAALKPWLSLDASGAPTLFVQVTQIGVETWLTLPTNAGQVDIAYVYPVTLAPGGADFIPVLHTEDRGLLFLKKISEDAPYSPYIPHPSYQFSKHESGVRNFLIADYDKKGGSFIRDETEKIEETIAAIKWYISLSELKSKNLTGSLCMAIDSPNQSIRNHAIRALAYRKSPDITSAFKERLSSDNQDFLVRLMLGLWILGEKETATKVLNGFYAQQGEFSWLEAWEIKPTLVRGCAVVETLYGPDPSEVKGD